MRMSKLIAIILVIAFSGLHLALLFYTPPPEIINQIDPNKLGYIALFENPVVLFLLCISLIIMLCGFDISLHKLGLQGVSMLMNTRSIILLIGLLVCMTAGILFLHWDYIHSNFIDLVSMLLYQGNNPRSAPDLTYNEWKYSLNPAKAIIALVFIPMIIPMFYHVLQLKRRKNSV